MSNANLFRDKIDFMIMELANKELKKDLELSLMLISLKKQNSFDLNNYEARKRHLLKSFEIDFDMNKLVRVFLNNC